MTGGAIAALLVALVSSPEAAPECGRDVDADLLTIGDRLAHGRLDAARAYIDDLLACTEGRAEPRVHLALATIEERLGHLNTAYASFLEARRLAPEDPGAGVEEALALFRARWVAVEVLPAAGATDVHLHHAGLVADDATGTCLAELEAALKALADDGLARTLWIVPGDYRLAEEEMRLPPGSSITLKVPFGQETP